MRTLAAAGGPGPGAGASADRGRRTRYCRVPAGRRLAFRALLVAAVLLTLLQGADGYAAERVAVRSAVHPDHARLVLDWSAPVSLRRRSVDGDLILSFDRAFEADLAEAGARLASHVTHLTATADGRGLRIGLRPGVVLGRFRQFEPDLVVVDLMQAASRPAPAEGRAAVRIGRHDGYMRLVFDFGAPVVHGVRAEGPGRILTFDRTADIDAAGLALQLRDVVDELAPSPGDRPGLVFRPRAGIEADVFALDEDKVVIDFREPPAKDAGAAPVADDAPPGPPEVRAAVAVGPESGRERAEALAPMAERKGSRLATAGPDAERPSRGTRGPAGPGEGGPPLEEAEGAAPGRAPEEVASAEETGTGGGGPGTAATAGTRPPEQRDPARASGDGEAPVFASARTGEGIELTLSWPEEVAAAVFQRAGMLWLVFDGAPDPAWRRRPPELDPGIARFIGPVHLDESDDDSVTILRLGVRRPLEIEVGRERRLWRILLRPEADPPAAVPVEQLDRPPRLRLVGDGPPGVIRIEDPLVGDRLLVWPLRPALGQPTRRDFVQVQLLATAQGVVLRTLADGIEVSGSEAGLEIGAGGGLHLSMLTGEGGGGTASGAGRAAGPDDRLALPRPVEADRSDARQSPSPDEQTRAAASDGPEETIAADVSTGAMATGEPFALPPAVPFGADIPGAARAPERSQIEPVGLPPDRPGSSGADPTSSAAIGDDREGHTPADSRHDDRGGSRADGPVSSAGAAAPLSLAQWALSEHDTVPDRRARLMRRVAGAEESLREAATLDLARFFLAQAMAAETLAVLEGAGADGAATSPHALARQSLAGAAELLMGRLLAAEQALDAPALDGDPEVALWRAAIAAARNDWAAAAAELGRSENTLISYPPALQLRLGLPAAMIAVEAGQPDHAFEILERVSTLDLHESDRAQLNFIRGLAHARTGDLDQAVDIWRTVERDGDEETQLKANYALATTLFGTERIRPDEALARLLPNRPLWRGHAWEVSMLDGLATIQMAADDAGGAIRTWQEALRLHPVAAARMGLEQKVRTAFRTALSADSRSPLSPVAALALYRTHPGLIPQGEEGLDLRRRLAERLSELDLIAPAVDLMEAVLSELPAGVAAARDGAMLAGLQLRAPDPAAALATLGASDAGNLPSGLAGQRIVLRAAALDAIGRSREAIVLLEGRDDPIGRGLMVDILWRLQDWPRLATVLERNLQGRSAADEVRLAADEQISVVKLAIARAQLGQTDELDRIARRFGPAMRGQAAEAAFLLATSRSRPATAPATVLAMAGRQMETIRAYLTQR